MPPRTAKKGGAASGTKRTARAVKGAPKSQKQQEYVVTDVTESVKVEEVSVNHVEVKEQEEVIVGVIMEEKPSEVEPELKSDANGSLSDKEEHDVKEAFDEDDDGERLELEDNEPEYEPEEDAGVDYDEKEVESDDGQEEGDEDEEEVAEEGDIAEDDGDMVEEEMEDMAEEIEDVEDENGEEQEQMVDGENEEHHEVVKERLKRKEFEIFVGGLDKDATEDDLKKVFSKIGEVVEVRLMRNPQTKKNKGFAFIRYATVEQAKRAVVELKNPVVNGKQCGVSPSQDNDTLFVGNICKTWTKEALKEKLKHYGIENVDDLTLVEDSNNEGLNRGFAFLEFPSRSDAMDAYKRLQKRDVVFGVDRNAKIAFADSFNDPDDEVMSKVKTIFVDGLPTTWDEDHVKDQLKKFGEIEKVELARNMPQAKRKDFGFVTFYTHDAAVVCAESINNTELGDGDNKVKVRARLSRPLLSGRGKQAYRGDFHPGRAPSRNIRGSWGRPMPHTFPGRSQRGIGGRMAPAGGRGFKRPLSFRDKQPVMAVSARGARHLPPLERSYDRRAPIPSYPKTSNKRDYSRRNEVPSRSRAVADYGSRVPTERRSSYRDDYSSRGPSYSDDVPRSASHTVARRAYLDEGYGRRFDRPPPSYREGRASVYDSISGSKRSYSALDDVPTRYADTSVRQSRARLDYGVAGSTSQYGDAYNDRLERSQLGYGNSRSSLTGQESHGLYGSRQGMGYGGGSFASADVGGTYSSNYTSDYMSRGPDVGGSSYSSLYSSRSLGGSSYLGGSGSGSYY